MHSAFVRPMRINSLLRLGNWCIIPLFASFILFSADRRILMRWSQRISVLVLLLSPIGAYGVGPDFNGDGCVDAEDLLILLDGIVDTGDLLIL